MSARRASDVPSLGVLVTGGIGVLVVLAFVGAVILGRQSRTEPGDRVAVAAGPTPDSPFAVVVARCAEERVRVVEIGVPDGEVLWRIESDRGTIDRTFLVGEAPPPFFATVVELRSPLPARELEVRAQVDAVVDRERFDPGALDASGDVVGVSCGDSDLGLLPIVFGIGAIGVAVAYGTMVRRYLGR